MTMALSSTVRGNMMTQINTAAGTSAVLTIYNGTRPATGGAATTALATLTCNASQFGTVSGAVLTASAITNATASATGTATWARLTSSGATFVADMDVGTSGSDLNLNTTSIVSGATVSVTSCVITAGNP
jgi:hypothetical protein